MWLATLATATAGEMPMKIKQRRHQEAAADAEHPRDESDRQPHGQDQKNIDRQVGDREIDLHAGGPAGFVMSGPKRHVTPTAATRTLSV